ncbi:carbohydrate ABC transporter permease [Spirilliplanes yamanashiensis]|uniref:Sugar ABC transporter permease n=1 Tax=Spirilliplanes yamanashiensis TaxID=42233 RepID=A0A8J3Y7Y8_9ACTN|nr:sugar ABC transporter permease [Spirilliplanes yamanashiensis]MDP9817415.1 cellobiose transport system permease protein [Spirilliplanes yamanashiensis]GIJ02933.1 sugar ABC transporter permease [Spirilliplanes yamanashiensis]
MTLQTDAGPPAAGAAPDAGAGPPPRPPATHRPGRTWPARLDIKASPYLYVAPFFVLFGIFGAFPLVYTAWVSLHDWDLIAQDPQFVGLANYQALLRDPDFWNSVVNTLGIFVLATVPQLLLALWLANTLNRTMRARTFFRMSALVPNITSTAAVAIIFNQIFSTDFGLVNWALGFTGLENVNWHSERYLGWVAVSTMVNWRWIGYNALIFLAAMQAVPRDLYESASIDGAGRARQFWSITVPMLKPTLVFCIIVSTIGNLQLFTEPLLFSSGASSIRGGAEREVQTITMYMYENAFAPYYNFGYGSAVAWMLFLLIVLIAIANALVTRRISGEGKR